MLMTNYLGKIIDLCVSGRANDNKVENILRCLDVCLQRYPSTCGPMRNKIEKFLFQFLDLEATDVAVKHAGRCFHFLQQVRLKMCVSQKLLNVSIENVVQR